MIILFQVEIKANGQGQQEVEEREEEEEKGDLKSDPFDDSLCSPPLTPTRYGLISFFRYIFLSFPSFKGI